MRRALWKFRRWLAQRWECATKQCTYYQHYLAYGPAELTHIGYHAAERHCIEAQKRSIAWYEAHPQGENPSLDRIAAAWEARVRA